MLRCVNEQLQERPLRRRRWNKIRVVVSESFTERISVTFLVFVIFRNEEFGCDLREFSPA
jgi:hypothetical protein